MNTAVLQTELFEFPIITNSPVLDKTYAVIANRYETKIYFHFTHWCVICGNVNCT